MKLKRNNENAGLAPGNCPFRLLNKERDLRLFDICSTDQERL